MGPRLLLINPVMRSNSGGCGSTGSGAEDCARRRLRNPGGIATMEPLALAYVAALTPSHWDVRIVDEVLEEIPADYQPDLVGLTSLSATVPRAYDIARHYRTQGVPVVLGGIHATLVPEEAEKYVDVVFQGEAEGNWPRLIRDFEGNSLRRRYNGNMATLCNLPLPRRQAYFHRYFMQLISASRGCRYRCEFCTLWKLEGGAYRARPPEEVLEELRTTHRRRPILFTDENVYLDREWALALFGAMAERGLKRFYAVQASLNIADDEQVLTALQRSGCFAVLIGFESLSEESLRIMRKAINYKIGVAHYRDKIAKLHDHGLLAAGTFIFGNDGDGPDIFARTAKFVQEAGVDIAHFGLLTPNPGTDLYERLAREGRLLYTNFPADYARYDLHTAVFRPSHMTTEQLEEGLVWATQAVGSRSAASQRAWKTWRAVGSLPAAVLAFRWNRTGQYRYIVDN